MEVKITVDLEDLKGRLCPECQKAMENYLKELAARALSQEARDGAQVKEK